MYRSLVICAAIIVAGSAKVLADGPNEIVLSDDSYSFNLRMVPSSKKIQLRTLKAERGLPISPTLKLEFADHTQMELRLVSAYEYKPSNHLFEGYLGPSASPLIGVELAFKTKHGLFRNLRWRFRGSQKDTQLEE